MKIAAIICEYNPLHNGHVHQIEETKKITGCDAILCIMSGNFSQRAEPCIMDKYTRANLVVSCGADAVVQIPTMYAINNAEVFAQAGVKIANNFKNVEYLSFGMETPNIPLLKELADFFIEEPENYKAELKNFLSKGLSFNNSRTFAVRKLIKEEKISFSDNAQVIHILTSPNNILALEYVKWLIVTKSSIEPIAIQRLGSGYHQTAYKGNFSSASAIRKRVYKKGKIKKIKNSVPENTAFFLEDYQKNYNFPDLGVFSDLALFTLRTTPLETLKNIYNVNEGLENRLRQLSTECTNLDELKTRLVTKRYKSSKIDQIILNSLLNINSASVKQIYKLKTFPYLKVLALSKSNPKFLSNLKCDSPLIIRKKDTYNIKNVKLKEKHMQIEDNANMIYNLLIKSNLLQTGDLYYKIKLN